MKLSLNTSNFSAFKMTTVAALLSLASVEPFALAAQQARQQPAAAPRAAAPQAQRATAAEEESEAPAKPGTEGLRVHGHWIIDVHNADGSIAEHRDFQNALDKVYGGNALIFMLAGNVTPTSMAIHVGTSGILGAFQPTYLINVSGNANAANISQCVTQTTFCVTGLTMSATAGEYIGGGLGIPANTPLPGSLTLQGQFAPSSAFSFNNVATELIGCSAGASFSTNPSPVTPTQCAAVTSSNHVTGSFPQELVFTATGVDTVNVAAGQYVVITVTITFS